MALPESQFRFGENRQSNRDGREFQMPRRLHAESACAEFMSPEQMQLGTQQAWRDDCLDARRAHTPLQAI